MTRLVLGLNYVKARQSPILETVLFCRKEKPLHNFNSKCSGVTIFAVTPVSVGSLHLVHMQISFWRHFSYKFSAHTPVPHLKICAEDILLFNCYFIFFIPTQPCSLCFRYFDFILTYTVTPEEEGRATQILVYLRPALTCTALRLGHLQLSLRGIHTG